MIIPNIKERLITQQELKKLVNYDSDTGIFTWKVKFHRNIVVGKEAGSIRKKLSVWNNRSYVRLSIKYKEYFAHRLAWLYMNGEYPNGQIDHMDGNGLNNRIDNLRDVTHLENGKNQKLPNRNTSGVCGVWWNKAKQRWQADIINDNKKKVFIGLFKEKEDAAKARKNAEIVYGYHENHGMPTL